MRGINWSGSVLLFILSKVRAVSVCIKVTSGVFQILSCKGGKREFSFKTKTYKLIGQKMQLLHTICVLEKKTNIICQ